MQQSVREALQEILVLADDQNWSHLSRMLKIKQIISRLLAEHTVEVKRPIGRPPAGAHQPGLFHGAKEGNGLSEAHRPGPKTTAV